LTVTGIGAVDGSRPGSPWEIPAFRNYLASVGTVTLAIQLQAAVVSYQVYELTKNPLSLGLVGLAEALPFISLALVGGYFADRHDRRRLSLLMLAVAGTLSLGLLALTLAPRALGVRTHTLAIYAILGLWGVCRSFLQPARGALYAEVLPPSLYAKSIAIRSSCFQLAMVSVPRSAACCTRRWGPTVRTPQPRR
jgi:MFS family permease